jgi:hypothetical protein
MVAGANQQGHWVTLNGQSLNGACVDTAFGSTVAGPMWAQAMRAVDEFLPNDDFVRPIPVSGFQPDAAIVPNVIGMTIDQASTILRDAGFQVDTGDAIPAEMDKGLVVQTAPQNGTTAYPGTTVTLFPSAGLRSAGDGGNQGGGSGDGSGDGSGSGDDNNRGRGNNGGGNGGGNNGRGNG